MTTKTFKSGYQEFTEEVVRESYGPKHDPTTFMVDVVRGWFPESKDGHHTTINVRMCRTGTMRGQLTLMQEDLDKVLLEDHWYEATALAADEADKSFWSDFLGYALENWEALPEGPIWCVAGDQTINEDIFFD